MVDVEADAQAWIAGDDVRELRGRVAEAGAGEVLDADRHALGGADVRERGHRLLRAGEALGAVGVLDRLEAGVDDGDARAHRRGDADIVRVQLGGAAAHAGVERGGVHRLVRVEGQVERADRHAAVAGVPGELRVGEAGVVATGHGDLGAGDACAGEGFEQRRVRMRDAADGDADGTRDHGDALSFDLRYARRSKSAAPCLQRGQTKSSGSSSPS